MQLLFSRDQRNASFSLVPLRLGTGVTFVLHAHLNLDGKEHELLSRYQLNRSPIVTSYWLSDIQQAFRPAAYLGVMVGLVGVLIVSLTAALMAAVIATIAMTTIYFLTLREHLTIYDLVVGGRTFYCESVRDLIEKEAYLEGVCQYLRQLLESAKHWDDREVIDIPPLDKEAAKQLVLAAK